MLTNVAEASGACGAGEDGRMAEYEDLIERATVAASSFVHGDSKAIKCMH